MSFAQNVSSIFKKIAPYLGAAVTLVPGGGPAVQIAANVLTKVTGTEVKPESIEATINNLATTEQGRITLQQSEQEYSKAMTQLGFDHFEKVLALQNADRDSARQLEVKTGSKMPAALAILAVVTLILCICLVAFAPLADKALGAVLTLVGFVGAAFKDVYAYFFGSSAGSDRKTELLSQAPPVSQ